MDSTFVTAPESIEDLIAAHLSEATGRSIDEIGTSSDLFTLEGINSIVIADAIDSIEDSTGLLADATLMTKDSLRTIARIAGIFS